jgi:hypothetical protein
MKKQIDAFWSEGQDAHTDMIIAKGKERIKTLLDKLKQSENAEEKRKIEEEVKHTELEIQQQINHTNQNIY